ncbi:hypothetical protein EXIGLDRAFT_161362 [Exidia glandulosa HHB12029]|uniref:Secreted protein n=1 Tax=Exidia glandulosa HHB12029 TaxID=1314781 RepID=A0A165FGJ5_EXIGL|nr:hypothetical protein EXIGLDRAFT_161362 [Exidia glandulosa HHB12029]
MRILNIALFALAFVAPSLAGLVAEAPEHEVEHTLTVNGTEADIELFHEFEKRAHHIKFVNKCSKTIRPAFHAVDGTSRYMKALKKGQSTSTTIAEGKKAWRVFGQTGGCSYPDGNKCTLLECSFENAKFRQCNISRVSGYNVGMSFSWSDKKCKGNSCLKKSCDGAHAFSNPTNGGKSLRQCNTPNVGMTVTFTC